MLYGPFAPVNNVPVPLGLDQEIACIMRLIAEARCPPRRGGAHSRRDREIPRPARRRLSGDRLGRRLQELVYRRSGHAGPVATASDRAQAFFAEVPAEEFHFIPTGQGDRIVGSG
jgi:hypothetical protein